MMSAAEASLRRLSTDYIDLCWMHIWGQPTPAEEIMRGLDDLARQAHICRLFDNRSFRPSAATQPETTLALRTTRGRQGSNFLQFGHIALAVSKAHSAKANW
jgi:aryl-alcohol dehydrogenase-like predicted oxidoreductase